MYRFIDVVRDIQKVKSGRLSFQKFLARYKDVKPCVFDLANKWLLRNTQISSNK